MKPLVYIAAPYTSPDPVENTNRVLRFAADLLDRGEVVPVVPHLSMLWHVVTPKPYQMWLEYDLELLARCDAVYRYPGDSSGADGEIAAARELGIPVLMNLAEFWAWVREATRPAVVTGTQP